MAVVPTSADMQAVQALQGELQRITSLLRDPGSQGEPNYESIRNTVGQLQVQLFPQSGTNVISYEQVREATLDAAKERPKVRQEIKDTKTRVEQVAATIEPIIRKADEQLKVLSDQSENIKQVTEAELVKGQQNADAALTKHQELIQHAQTKFQEIEVKQTDLFNLAGTKFQEMETNQQVLMNAAKAKFDEMDNKFASMGNMMKLLETMKNDDVIAVRTKLAEQGIRDGNNTPNTPFKRAVSEFKAVGNLVSYNSDSRTGLKVWLGKFKNAISQSRGPDWEEVLDRLDKHRITADFEELTSQDDQWDEWFESNFGINRTDGQKVIDLKEFKADLFWILKDKLGEQYITITQKYGKNGLRAYKKLYTWSVDISDEAKSIAMNAIMNPKQAKSDSDLASHIESWDFDCQELLKVDATCELKDPFRLVAFKSLLTNTMSNYILNQIDPAFTTNYDFIRSKVYAWALKRRFEHKPSAGMSAMNIPDQLESTYITAQPDHSWPYTGIPAAEFDAAGTMGWGGGQESWGEGDPYWGTMEAMGAGKSGFKGKGKGKGKGFQGNCHTCGKYGHRASECRGGKPTDKGGKGKGGFKGGPGKGYKGGKGNYKGGTPGKGMHAFGDTGQYWGSWGGNTEGGMAAVTQFQGSCHGCGIYGHSWKYCRKTNPNALPEPNGKGNPGPTGEVAQMAPGTSGPPGPGACEVPKTPAGPLRAMSFGGKFEALKQEPTGPRDGWFQGKSKLPGWNFELLMLPKTKSVHWAEIQDTEDTPGATGSIGNTNALNPVVTTENKVKWKQVKLTVDSGACDHVVNRMELPGAVIKETQAVRDQVTYTTACGTIIPNLGEIDLTAVTEDGVNLDLTVQVADVKQPLAAVRKICKAGNRVVFDNEESGCYIENKETQARTQISFEDGTYAVKLWVPIGGEESRAPTVAALRTAEGPSPTATYNRFSTFEEAEQDWESFDADFLRRA